MVVDSRPNYIDVPEYDDGALLNPPEVGNNRYDSNLDLITEHEVVPDFVERISPRYTVEYNNETEIANKNNSTIKYFIPGSNKSKLIKMVNLLMSHLPLALNNGDINNINSVICQVKAGDKTVTLEFKKPNIKILRAHLASNNMDITECFDESTTSNGNSVYIITPTIPFKYDDEIVVFFK